MQKLTQARWSLEANYHIGDLAWQRYRHAGREDEWITAIWEVDGKPVAWGWVKLPGSLMLQVDRAAFPQSRVIEESYGCHDAYPYDSSLDWVIESPNGEFAACCLIWFDEVNKVGLLEPVGTDPRYWRTGLGSSVCSISSECFA